MVWPWRKGTCTLVPAAAAPRPFATLEVRTDPCACPDFLTLAVGVDEFEERLVSSLALWEAEGKSAVWIRAPEEAGAHVCAAARHGFRYHHAEEGSAMLSKWLAPRQSMIPPYATHKAGPLDSACAWVRVWHVACGVSGGGRGGVGDVFWFELLNYPPHLDVDMLLPSYPWACAGGRGGDGFQSAERNPGYP